MIFVIYAMPNAIIGYIYGSIAWIVLLCFWAYLMSIIFLSGQWSRYY